MTDAATMSAGAIADVVTTDARLLGWDIAPTICGAPSPSWPAGHASLEHIQLALGHRNIHAMVMAKGPSQVTEASSAAVPGPTVRSSDAMPPQPRLRQVLEL